MMSNSTTMIERLSGLSQGHRVYMAHGQALKELEATCGWLVSLACSESKQMGKRYRGHLPRRDFINLVIKF
jgi:hypothetical protein